MTIKPAEADLDVDGHGGTNGKEVREVDVSATSMDRAQTTQLK